MSSERKTSLSRSDSRSISKDLTISLVITIVTVSVLAIGMNYYHIHKKSELELEAKADEYVIFLSQSLEMPLWNFELGTIRHIGEFFAGNEGVVGLKIIDFSGKVFFDFNQKSTGHSIKRIQNVYHRGEFVGSIHLLLAPYVDKNRNAQLLLVSIVHVLVVLLSLVVVTGFLLRIFLRKPLNHLSEIVKSYASGNYDSSVYHVLYTEFQPFIDVLDQMGKKIKAQMNALQMTEEKYRSIFENAIEGIYQSSREGRFISANPAMARIYGYDSPEQLIQSVDDIAQQCYADPQVRKSFCDMLEKKGKIVEFETLMKRKEGAQIWASESARAVFNQHGQVEYYEGSVVDISERKRIESLRQEKITAEADAKAKSEFLANMSHEIRTPMNAILGLTRLVLNTELTGRQKDYLDKIDASTRLLLRIINDILDFSKIEAGKMELETMDFQLHNVLNNLADMFSSKVAEKGLELNISVASDVPCALYGDPLRLGQILINLTENAVKFTKNGEILVKVRLVKQTDERALLEFSVTDTGIGISMTHLSRLFSSFTQADGSTTREYGGTGLGLSICRRLVEMMGGQILVESEPGQGSKFTFTIDIGVQSEHQRCLFDLPGDLEKKNILVVDDNENSKTILKTMLESFGLTSETVSSGGEALKILRSSSISFDMIILDYHMPGMSGIDAAGQIKADPDFSDIPVVLVADFGKEDIYEAAGRIGITNIITKPISKSMLFNAVMSGFGKTSLMLPEEEKTMLSSKTEDAGDLEGSTVLLVEDNSINQQVATEILESAGIMIDIAQNGRQAVDAFCRREYDAILMDIQMPEMDGYEATVRIREIEKKEGRPEVPIIAMTAHAMKDDKEKCFHSGMNDYVTKPIDIEGLFEVLAQWINQDVTIGEAPDEKQVVSLSPERSESRIILLGVDLPGLDVEAALKELRGNEKLFMKIADEFVSRYADTALEIRAALNAGDRKLAQRLSHTLKGVAGIFNARRLQDQAFVLEKLMKDPDPSGVDQAIDSFESALTETLESLARLIRLNTDTPDPCAQNISLEPSKLEAILKKLYQMIKDNNPRAELIVEELKSVFKGSEEVERYRQLSRQVDSFDFKNAQNTLGKIMTSLNIVPEENP